jgi:hypothetical protein
MEGRDLAISWRGKIAIGVVSLLAPGLVGRTMTGPNRSEGRTVGVHDVGLGTRLLVASAAARLCAAGSERPMW